MMKIIIIQTHFWWIWHIVANRSCRSTATTPFFGIKISLVAPYVCRAAWISWLSSLLDIFWPSSLSSSKSADCHSPYLSSIYCQSNSWATLPYLIHFYSNSSMLSKGAFLISPLFHRNSSSSRVFLSVVYRPIRRDSWQRVAVPVHIAYSKALRCRKQKRWYWCCF